MIDEIEVAPDLLMLVLEEGIPPRLNTIGLLVLRKPTGGIKSHRA
ncbi:hypothetical protein [Terriglobus sp.]